MRNILAIGFLGTATPTTGIYISLLPQVEAWLRITSLLVGILVGLASLALLVMKFKRRYLSKDEDTTTT